MKTSDSDLKVNRNIYVTASVYMMIILGCHSYLTFTNGAPALNSIYGAFNEENKGLNICNIAKLFLQYIIIKASMKTWIYLMLRLYVHK